MPAPLDIENKPLAARLKRARLRAFLIILLENLTASTWRITAWCGFFSGLWLFQIPAVFGSTGAIATFLIFIIGILYFIRTDLIRLRKPEMHEIDRRIEEASRLKHRPLAALDDSLANPLKPQTRRLWEIARAHTLALLRSIRAGQPKAFMASRDPYALRLGILLFFGLGIYAAGPSWSERITRGLSPFDFSQSAATQEKLTLWITPPEYTGLAPAIIKGGSEGKTIDIPSGSILKISVHGGMFKPRLLSEGRMPLPFKKADEGNYILDAPVPPGKTLSVWQGVFMRASWSYRIIPDEPPKISLKGKVETGPEATLRFPLEVADDYGVKNLVMHMTLNQSVSPETLGDPEIESRIVMSPPGKPLAINPVYDLAWHPWAGQPASITFTAEDGKGQAASSAPILMILPERNFMHPAASALIAERKKLIDAPAKDYEAIVNALENVLVRPKMYLDDKIVFLAIRSAASRLFWADPPSRETGASVVSLLWDTALRIEGGETSLAARNLRDAQNELAKTLDDPNASAQDIQIAMDKLRAAMAQYFTELQRDMQKRMAQGQKFPVFPPDMLTKTLDPEALNDFLEKLQARMMAGDKNAARSMLGQLQRLMDMMDPSSLTASMPHDMQMMNDGIDALQTIVRHQKELLEQTAGTARTQDIFKNIKKDFGKILNGSEKFPRDWNMSDMPPPPTAPKNNTAEQIVASTQKESQDSIRVTLGELMVKASESLGKVPENMALADHEMDESSKALGENDPANAIPRQEQAIKYLEQAQKNLSAQLMARLQQMTGLTLMGGGMKFDPLGRPMGGNRHGNSLLGTPVKIPDEGERKKAEELLRLIRNRSGELERPEEERDYFKRLLKQF